jgi:NAD(P)H-dependent flavin oxidoreductase YrpB (nitropropane dioxygenase family)
MDAGAVAVRIGTRFLAAEESQAHEEYVNALISASASDTEVTEAFGADWPDAPHRVLSASIEAARAETNDVVATLGEGEDAWPIQRFSSVPPNKAVRGNITAMALYAGTSVGDVKSRQPASEIVAELMALL